MNVQSIHSAEFAQRLPAGFLAQVRDLANFHEYGVFSDASLNGIGNGSQTLYVAFGPETLTNPLVAARTMLPSILTAFNRIANSSDPLKLHYSSISYKPFLSLFNMTGVVQSDQLPGAIGKPSSSTLSYFTSRYRYHTISFYSELCCLHCIRSSSTGVGRRACHSFQF